MRPTAGISTTAPRGDGARTETQPAPDSPNPALPGPVAAAPSAARDAASRQDAIKTPLTFGDSLDIAEKAIVAAGVVLPSGQQFRLVNRISEALLAVDHARGQQDREDTADLLGDVLDLLVKVDEWADGAADADGDTPNAAMHLLSDLRDSYGSAGLLGRVRRAWEAGK